MSLLERAIRWAENDPDPETKSELEELIRKKDEAQLESRFSKLLQFGTAGLRGELGAGPNRMNRVVVGYAALAIGMFLERNKSQYLNPSGELSVVIGYDGRLNSDIFAKDSASIFAAMGINTFLFDRKVPTPVAAFTGRRLGASATIVVTASHNPPMDNGYKVYLGGKFGGSQLISPQDKEIAGLISSAYENFTFAQIAKADKFQMLSQIDIEHYVRRATELVSKKNANRGKLKITHTALHGVGWFVVEELFSKLGFEVHSVAAQQNPDGKFPTVSFPNPEEAGAMDLAFAEATRSGSDLILANDPDADRLAVAVPVGDGWQMLTGDEVGILLADYCAQRHPNGTIANSIVSAEIGKLASKYGLAFQQTLTGFKWISKVPNLIYGYEEALGYCVDPSHTPDKDGITAALLIAELAADLKAEGIGLLDKLGQLSKEIGEISTGQVSIRVQDLSVISKIMSHVRAKPPLNYQGELEVIDLADSEEMKTDAVILQNSKVRMIFRPSGTEPKLKCYLQVNGNKTELEGLKEFANDYLSDAQ